MTDHFGANKIMPWSLAAVYEDIGSKSDIAKTLDVPMDRVHMWLVRRERIHCPMPIRRVGHVDLYSMQEWKDWFERWQTKHKRGTKWTDEAKPHGSGESFFSYFLND